MREPTGDGPDNCHGLLDGGATGSLVGPPRSRSPAARGLRGSAQPAPRRRPPTPYEVAGGLADRSPSIRLWRSSRGEIGLATADLVGRGRSGWAGKGPRAQTAKVLSRLNPGTCAASRLARRRVRTGGRGARSAGRTASSTGTILRRARHAVISLTPKKLARNQSSGR